MITDCTEFEKNCTREIFNHFRPNANLSCLLLPLGLANLVFSTCWFLSSSRFACKSVILLSHTLCAYLTVSPFFLLVLACTFGVQVFFFSKNSLIYVFTVRFDFFHFSSSFCFLRFFSCFSFLFLLICLRFFFSHKVLYIRAGQM